MSGGEIEPRKEETINDVVETMHSTIEDRRAAAAAEAEKLLGDQSVESLAAQSDTALAEMEEFYDLAYWYTDAYDQAMVDITEGPVDSWSDEELKSRSRRRVKQSNPAKFDRFRELEKLIGVRGAAHQQVASIAHASVAEANVRSGMPWL